MTELSINVLLAAGQMLLGEEERAFIAACNTVCVISEAGDGWPGIRVLDAASTALEIVNSQSLRMRFDPASIGANKIALMLIRHSDGQHLVLHGHVAASSAIAEGEPRVRISIASRSWSPELSEDIDPIVARALNRP